LTTTAEGVPERLGDGRRDHDADRAVGERQRDAESHVDRQRQAETRVLMSGRSIP